MKKGKEERKRPKEEKEKVFLMTNLRDLIIQEGIAVACAKRRHALCFIRLMIEQISVPALNTCVKMLKEGDERAKVLLLLALLEMHQSKPMRVNMRETQRSRLWRSGLCENPRETTQAIDDIVWECRDESKDGNGTDRRLPWRNRACLFL